jgi:hypothetical protein
MQFVLQKHTMMGQVHDIEAIEFHGRFVTKHHMKYEIT